MPGTVARLAGVELEHHFGGAFHYWGAHTCHTAVPSETHFSQTLQKGAPNCSWIKEFHNTPEWSLTKVYLFRDKLTVKVVIHSPMCALETETKSGRKKKKATHAFYLHLQCMRSHPKWASILKPIDWRSSHNTQLLKLGLSTSLSRESPAEGMCSMNDRPAATVPWLCLGVTVKTGLLSGESGSYLGTRDWGSKMEMPELSPKCVVMIWEHCEC